MNLCDFRVSKIVKKDNILMIFTNLAVPKYVRKSAEHAGGESLSMNSMYDKSRAFGHYFTAFRSHSTGFIGKTHK